MKAKVTLEFKAVDAEKAVEREDVTIVIDALRSGSSIVKALASGAQSVIPTATLNEAYKLHSQHPEFLLAGERGGLKPRGFDLGNSPSEFTSERVRGKNIIMTTTSGTMALARSKQAKWVFVGTFPNSGSVADRTIETAEKQRKNVSLVLAGERGRFSLEDFICAGAIVERFPRSMFSYSDSILAALLAFKQAKNNLCKVLMEAEHARRLMRMRFRNDVQFCCKLDILMEVPIYRDGRVALLR